MCHIITDDNRLHQISIHSPIIKLRTTKAEYSLYTGNTGTRYSFGWGLFSSSIFLPPFPRLSSCLLPPFSLTTARCCLDRCSLSWQPIPGGGILTWPSLPERWLVWRIKRKKGGIEGKGWCHTPTLMWGILRHNGHLFQAGGAEVQTLDGQGWSHLTDW